MMGKKAIAETWRKHYSWLATIVMVIQMRLQKLEFFLVEKDIAAQLRRERAQRQAGWPA